MKKFATALMVVGILLVVAALVLPLVMLLSGHAYAGIIGGAGWPTYLMLFRTKAGWIAGIGAVLAVVGMILRLCYRGDSV